MYVACMFFIRGSIDECAIFSLHTCPCLAGPHEGNGPDSHEISAMEVIGLCLILYLHIYMIYLLAYIHVHTSIHLLPNMTLLPI